MRTAEVVIKMIQGIIDQGGPAIINGTCVYKKADDGKKCAMGQLIPKELYSLDMEGLSIARLLHDFPALKDAIGNLDDRDIKLLNEIQVAHDKVAMMGWDWNIWYAWMLGSLYTLNNTDNSILRAYDLYDIKKFILTKMSIHPNKI